jgi:hypothetical protein
MVWKVVKIMIFSELYSAYYHAVAKILAAAVDHPLQDGELRHIVETCAFEESSLNILPALKEERWQLLRSDGTTPLKNAPSMPLTTLEKQWLKAIAQDPRIRLFDAKIEDFPEVEPLFRQEDILIFDQYSDGDDYEDETYINNFRMILDAIKKRYPLKIKMTNRNGKPVYRTIMPDYLEYSEKDDKFRLIGAGKMFGNTINLGRILSCRPCEKPYEQELEMRGAVVKKSVVFELIDRRKALERVLLHFAHFQKQAERLEEDRYRVTVFYEEGDETEMVIRILSFGPMVKVTAPQDFVELIRKRLIEQSSQLFFRDKNEFVE